jgi:hypothetical protein
MRRGPYCCCSVFVERERGWTNDDDDDDNDGDGDDDEEGDKGAPLKSGGFNNQHYAEVGERVKTRNVNPASSIYHG